VQSPSVPDANLLDDLAATSAEYWRDRRQAGAAAKKKNIH